MCAGWSQARNSYIYALAKAIDVKYTDREERVCVQGILSVHLFTSRLWNQPLKAKWPPVQPLQVTVKFSWSLFLTCQTDIR